MRLDPDRALSQRLRDQLAAWPRRPFHLVVALAPSIRLLRPLEARVERPPVTRPRSDRDADPEWVDPENALADLEALVDHELAWGAMTLAQVTGKVLPRLPDTAHYAATGRIAHAVAKVSSVRSERERLWNEVLPWLEIEDWSLPARERR